MRAINLDKDIKCPICKGTKKGPTGNLCSRCSGAGIINRYRDRASAGEIVLGEEIDANKSVLFYTMQITKRSGEGFDDIYGPNVPSLTAKITDDIDTLAGKVKIEKIMKSKNIKRDEARKLLEDGTEVITVEDFLDTLPITLKNRILSKKDLTVDESIAFAESIGNFKMAEFIRKWREEGLIT